MPPESFGDLVRNARKARGWSQARLAEELCLISERPTVARQEVYRWEKGLRIPRFWLRHVAAALGIPRARLETATAEQGSPSTLLTSLLPEGDPLVPLQSGSGRRIGADTARDVASRVHALRLADDHVAGGDLITPARRELAAAVRLYREGAHSDTVGRALLAAVGELAQITGWIESDAGRHDQAESTYRLGLSAAREAGDTALAGNLAGSLAYQWTNTCREDDGLALAQAAVVEAGKDAPPKTRALFLDRVAWANAKLNNAQPAMRALEEAHQALQSEENVPPPEWAYWVNDDELQIMDARVYTELHRPLRAVPVLREVLQRYDTTHTRELALYLSWLAVAYADANEPEAAAEVASRVLALSAEISSDRAAERSRIVIHRLAEYSDVPEVREVLDAP